MSPVVQTFDNLLICSYRLTIFSHEEVETMAQEPVCADDCYKPCGNIENEEDYGNVGEDVVLRFFFIRLSDLPNYVGDNPKRVYLYAQTVVIDYDFTATYALLINARQVRTLMCYVSMNTILHNTIHLQRNFH